MGSSPGDVGEAKLRKGWRMRYDVSEAIGGALLILQPLPWRRRTYVIWQVAHDVKCTAIKKLGRTTANYKSGLSANPIWRRLRAFYLQGSQLASDISP